jgi:hypothetical protein
MRSTLAAKVVRQYGRGDNDFCPEEEMNKEQQLFLNAA